MEEIKQGDVVELKSGGPKMTVNDLSNGYAECVYFLNDEAKFVNVYRPSLNKISGQ